MPVISTTWQVATCQKTLGSLFLALVIDETKYFSIYRDDGRAVFPGTWTQTEAADWLSKFQRSWQTMS